MDFQLKWAEKELLEINESIDFIDHYIDNKEIRELSSDELSTNVIDTETFKKYTNDILKIIDSCIA